MKRKDIRKALKKWVYRSEKTSEVSYLFHMFVDVVLGKSKMSREFESLVDEVYKMIQEEKNEKTRRSTVA